jgi:hypothetical protein
VCVYILVLFEYVLQAAADEPWRVQRVYEKQRRDFVFEVASQCCRFTSHTSMTCRRRYYCVTMLASATAHSTCRASTPPAVISWLCAIGVCDIYMPRMCFQRWITTNMVKSLQQLLTMCRYVRMRFLFRW